MTKKFEPKITPGPWVTTEQNKFKLEWVDNAGNRMELLPGDKQLILASPDMLEVVKAARKVIRYTAPFPKDLPSSMTLDTIESYKKRYEEALREAIQALDDKHGTEARL